MCAGSCSTAISSGVKILSFFRARFSFLLTFSNSFSCKCVSFFDAFGLSRVCLEFRQRHVNTLFLSVTIHWGFTILGDNNADNGEIKGLEYNRRSGWSVHKTFFRFILQRSYSFRRRSLHNRRNRSITNIIIIIDIDRGLNGKKNCREAFEAGDQHASMVFTTIPVSRGKPLANDYRLTIHICLDSGACNFPLYTEI